MAGCVSPFLFQIKASDLDHDDDYGLDVMCHCRRNTNTHILFITAWVSQGGNAYLDWELSKSPCMTLSVYEYSAARCVLVMGTSPLVIGNVCDFGMKVCLSRRTPFSLVVPNASRCPPKEGPCQENVL